MSKEAAGPVIAGLAAGIILVLLFASFFASTNPIQQRKFHLDLSIEGLKDRYSIGERIDIIIRATGYGTACGYPIAKVINIDKNEIVRTIESGIDVMCDPEPHDFDKTWALADFGITTPVTIDKIGHYKIEVDFGKAIAEKYFIVDDTVKQAIDKTRNLDEVKAFLDHYPNANATVYFVTTCADKACETLIRVPSIVEYFQEDGGKMAFLRISLEHAWDGEPISFQLSCQLAGSEQAGEIHSSIAGQENVIAFLQSDGRCPQ
jgi:hypothetical protein